MQQNATAPTKIHSELLLWPVLNSCSCLCSFMPGLLQSSPVQLSSASFKHTTKSSKQCCLPCPEFPKLAISLLNLLLSIDCPLIHKSSTNLLLWATNVSTWPLLSTWLNSWQSPQPASYAFLLIFPFSVFPLCTRTHLCCTVWNSLPCQIRSNTHF